MIQTGDYVSNNKSDSWLLNTDPHKLKDTKDLRLALLATSEIREKRKKGDSPLDFSCEKGEKLLGQSALLMYSFPSLRLGDELNIYYFCLHMFVPMYLFTLIYRAL